MIVPTISAFLFAGQRWRRAWQVIGLSLCLAGPLQASPVVVTSIKPLQLIAAAITDGISTPDLFMDAGHDPHHVTLRPSDRRKLQQADVVVWVGPALELPLQDVMPQLEARVITAQQLDSARLLNSEGVTDPHLWLDSRNARAVAGALTEVLQELDPANGERYAANLDRFTGLADTTDADIAKLLQPYQTSPWAASHQAFGYFTTQFGLAPPLTLTDSSNNTAGVRRVMELRAAITAQQIHCLLTETSENPAQLDTVLEDLGMHIVAADVLGNELPAEAGGYAQLMRALADRMADCLGGAAR